MKVKLTELQNKVHEGIKKLGYQGEDAQIIADVLLYAQLRGNNQGIAKIATGGVPNVKELEDFRVVRQNKCGALMSGGHAMVATVKAAKMATKLAAEHGVGIVGSNHTFTSSGAVGYFARKIADAGYIGLVCVGTGPFVAPYGSAEAKLGTNPLSYAFPTKSKSIVYDTTTAAMAFFGVVEHKLSNKPLPKGTGFDAEGNPSTDAGEVLDGSVATLAGHKGFGLSLLVQTLGGPFVGASFVNVNRENGAGTFVMAIDPGLFVDKEEFLNQADTLVKEILSAKPLPRQKVMLPGERGDGLAKQVEESGEIEIADGMWNQLRSFVDDPAAVKSWE